MVLEQAAKLIPKIAPEIGEASSRLLAETIPTIETGIKAYVFGGAKSNAGNAGKLASIHFPQKGPVWNEEVLFRHNQQVELGEELLFPMVALYFDLRSTSQTRGIIRTRISQAFRRCSTQPVRFPMARSEH
ncbi:MAG: hypothetical protein IPK73_14250 [Candidatus Obscuribacter sp.]|nr:hypothetical protein [Candidatus Obscuribacter sp.]